MTMTLDEAIKHCEEVACECKNNECGNNHKQLAKWLTELKERRASEINNMKQQETKDLEIDGIPLKYMTFKIDTDEYGTYCVRGCTLYASTVLREHIETKQEAQELIDAFKRVNKIL